MAKKDNVSLQFLFCSTQIWRLILIVIFISRYLIISNLWGVKDNDIIREDSDNWEPTTHHLPSSTQYLSTVEGLCQFGNIISGKVIVSHGELGVEGLPFYSINVCSADMEIQLVLISGNPHYQVQIKVHSQNVVFVIFDGTDFVSHHEDIMIVISSNTRLLGLIPLTCHDNGLSCWINSCIGDEVAEISHIKLESRNFITFV